MDSETCWGKTEHVYEYAGGGRSVFPLCGGGCQNKKNAMRALWRLVVNKDRVWFFLRCGSDPLGSELSDHLIGVGSAHWGRKLIGVS